MRRRIGAGAVVLLAAVWLISSIAGGGGGRVQPPPVGAAVAAGVHEARAAASSHAASSAELKREQRAVQSALSYTSYVTEGSQSAREIALTFDDGPGPFTPQVLGVLERMHVPATFFVVGNTLTSFGAQVPRELAGGFPVEDHTQNHRVMAQLSRKDQTQELIQQISGIRGLGAPQPTLFRPPYGSFNATTLALSKKLKMLPVLWTIDTKDFSRPGVPAIEQAVLSGAKPGAIVLMHDAGGDRSETVAALPAIIRALRARHFKLVTVPRLLADDPPLTIQKAPAAGGGG